jgi:hypothetical protein
MCTAGHWHHMGWLACDTPAPAGTAWGVIQHPPQGAREDTGTAWDTTRAAFSLATPPVLAGAVWGSVAVRARVRAIQYEHMAIVEPLHAVHTGSACQSTGTAWGTGHPHCENIGTQKSCTWRMTQPFQIRFHELRRSCTLHISGSFP